MGVGTKNKGAAGKSSRETRGVLEMLHTLVVAVVTMVDGRHDSFNQTHKRLHFILCEVYLKLV